MINPVENIEVFEKVILKYIISQDDDYVLKDESHNEVDKNTLIKTIQPSYFSLASHVEVFKCIRDFHKSHNTIPNREELVKLFPEWLS